MALNIGASSDLQPVLSEHAGVHKLIFRQNSGMPGGVLKHGDLTFKRHRIEHILSPRVPMALNIGAFCSLQPRLSNHNWV